MNSHALRSGLAGACLLLLGGGAAAALAAPSPSSPTVAVSTAPAPASLPALPDSLDLATALGFALQHNYSIRQAQERIRHQEGVIVEVKALSLPSVGAATGYQHNDREISSTFPTTDRFWSLSVRATQVLYGGGGISASARSQEELRTAAVLALQATVDEALAATRMQFYTALLARDSVKVQEENVTLLQRQLDDIRHRREAGLVSPFEVLRAEVALANAQPALIRARNDHRLALEQLRQLLGVVAAPEPAHTPGPTLVGSLAFTPTHFDLSSLLATARQQRPEWLRQQKLARAAEENIRLQQANRLPSLALFGAYDWRRSPTARTFSQPTDGWTIGLQSQWNLFDGRATAGKVAQARSQLDQIRLAADELQLAIEVEVRRALSAWQEASELMAASHKVVAAAEESLRLAQVRFGSGTATQLDVLTSQVALTEARLNQLQASYRYLVAVTQVRKAAGLGDATLSRPATP